MHPRSSFSHLRFIPHMPDDLIWKQYGTVLADLPPEEQERRVLLIPVLYRDYIRGRLNGYRPPTAVQESQ